jgi:fatty acid desaturase
MALSLPELDRIDRDRLVDGRGITYAEFRRSLAPSYTRVWRDIGAGYLALGLLLGAVVLLDQRLGRLWWLLGAAGGLCIGYVLAYLLLFFHEAAHFNLAKSRAANDALADLLIGSFTGQTIKAYRVVHMDHHRLLGTPDDTEHSYFRSPGLGFLLEHLLGVRLLSVMAERRAHVARKAALLLGLAAWARCWSLVVAWPVAVLMVMPTFTAVRQLLEHRRFDASSSTNYGLEPHGACTRMFASGPIGSTLGGAGFNRHLLHHWEPQVSYTNLAELEAFLLQTEAAPIIRSAKTHYVAAWRRLDGA